MGSKNAKKRKKAKRRRFARSSAGRKKLRHRAVHHVRFCPPSGVWWLSNDPEWSPRCRCQKCGLVYRHDLNRDEIVVEGVGRFPASPTALDLLALLP